METKHIAASGFSKPAAANPVMDVVSPPPTVEKPPNNKSEIDPLDELAAEAQAEKAAAETNSKKPAAKPSKPKRAADSPGVGLAITATVIIVLGLAALATYAYIQTAK